MADESTSGMTYRASGVDLEAADAAVAAIGGHLRRTARPEVLDNASGFGGLFALDIKRWRRPVLVSATDGVGTKLELARQLDRWDTVGIDLVAMVVDDLVVPGAEPLFFLDYLATGRLDPVQVERIVAGIADGCEQAGCALIGGETAEHPGTMDDDQVDLAGFGVGVVDQDAMLGPQRVKVGDEVVALASTGLHSNGYSLARRIVADAQLDLHDDHGMAVQSLGDALLRPTRIYAPAVLALAAAREVSALCHITGGGIPGNLPRALPDGLGAVLDASTFEVPTVIGILARAGGVPRDELWRVFNMGAGMIAICEDGSAAVSKLRAHDVDAWVCGRVVEGSGVELRNR